MDIGGSTNPHFLKPHFIGPGITVSKELISRGKKPMCKRKYMRTLWYLIIRWTVFVIQRVRDLFLRTFRPPSDKTYL